MSRAAWAAFGLALLPAAAMAGQGGYIVSAPREETAQEKAENQARAAAADAEKRRWKSEVDAELIRLGGGEHRRAEAERLVRLRLAAEKARNPLGIPRPAPAPQPAAAVQPVVTPAPFKPTDARPKQCPFPGYQTSDSWGGKTVAEARTRLLAAQGRACTNGVSNTVRGTIMGSVRCAAPRTLKLKKGALTSEARCEVTYQCPGYTANCPSGGGKASKATQQ